MRIAIIGATGMLGRHTALSASQGGHDIVAVGRHLNSMSSLSGPGVELRKADLNDPASITAALAGTDAVINCAGYYPGAPRPWREEVRTATTLMQNFYDACASQRLRKIVYLGAAIALPRDPSGQPGTESLDYETAPRSHNPYLRVKWAMDTQARAMAGRGLPVTIGIPSMSFGEFDPGNTTGRFIIEMANRTLPGYVDGRRNVIYAGDAGRGLVRVCEDGLPGERYLLTGENLTMAELLAKVAAIVGAPMPKPIPLGAARLVSAVQSLRYAWLRGPEPKISSSAIAVMSSGQFLDGSKASQALNFQSAISVDDAIRRAFDWFRAQGMVNGSSEGDRKRSL
jgi:dihydroflavonol-4-reductase